MRKIHVKPFLSKTANNIEIESQSQTSEPQEICTENSYQLFEYYSNVENIQKISKSCIKLETLKKLYMITPKDRECLLYQLQHKNDEAFDGINYTRNMIGLFNDCYNLPKSSSSNKSDYSAYPYDELFMWSFTLYSGKDKDIELMKQYWSITYSPITCCIAVILLSKRLMKSQYLPDYLNDGLINVCLIMRKMTIGLMMECFNSDWLCDQERTKMIAQDLLIKQTPIFYFRTFLEIAVEAEEFDIINASPVQSLLTNIWYSSINPFVARWKLALCLVCPLFAFFPIRIFNNDTYRHKMIYQELQNHDADSTLRISLDSQSSQNLILPKKSISNTSTESNPELKIYAHIPSKTVRFRNYTGVVKFIRRLNWFLDAPIVKFTYHLTFYLLFLTGYSVFILFDYHPMNFGTTQSEDTQSETPSNTTSKPLQWYDAGYGGFPIKLSEMFLIFWILMHQLDNFIEFHKVNVPYKFLSYKLRRYFINRWNIVDMCLFGLSYVAIVVRLIPEDNQVCPVLTNETCFETGRCLYCLALILWFIRLLKYLKVIEYWGSKIIIMGKIVLQLTAFIILIFIFVLSFSAAFQSMLYKTIEPNVGATVAAFNRVYWPIFGEFSFLDEIKDQKCPNGTSSCDYSLSYFFLYTSAAIYIIICNLLLLNMMIAVFSSTVEDMTSKSQEIYKFHRYQNIKHYDKKLVTPAPTILIGYLFLLPAFCFNRQYFRFDNFCIYHDDKSEQEYTDFQRRNLKRYMEEIMKEDDNDPLKNVKNSIIDKYELLSKKNDNKRRFFANSNNKTEVNITYLETILKKILKQNEEEFKDLNLKMKQVRVELNEIKAKIH